jgi:hypothetical protein
MRVKGGERGGWKKGTWGRRYREGGWWVYEKERASRIEGRETDQHNRHCQPTRSSRFYVWIWIPLDWIDPSPHPGQGQPGQIIHIIPLRPLIVSAHTAPSVIPTLSGQLHSPPVTAHCSHSRCCAPFPRPRLFIGLPAIPPPNTVAHHTPAFAPCPNRASVSLQTLQGTKY